MAKRKPGSTARRPSEWLDRQRERLDAEREKLRGEIESESRLLGVTGTPRPREDGDLAEEEREDGEVSNTVEVLQRKLEQVEAALARLRRGDYGACSDCRKSIPVARLDAVPSATRCKDCQTAVEKRGESRRI